MSGLKLTQSADLLPEVQPGPLVGDGLQHLLQGSVHLAVLLRWPSSLAQSRDGRHLRAGIMTIRGFTAGEQAANRGAAAGQRRRAGTGPVRSSGAH